MKIKFQITIERMNDTEHRADTLKADIDNPLHIHSVNAALPEKGCSSVRLQDGCIHQITYKMTEPGNNVVRLRFPHCGNMVTIAITDLELRQASVEDFLNALEIASIDSSNQSDRFDVD